MCTALRTKSSAFSQGCYLMHQPCSCTQTELHAMMAAELTLGGLPGSSAASNCSLCQAGTYGTGSGRPRLHVTCWSLCGRCDVRWMGMQEPQAMSTAACALPGPSWRDQVCMQRHSTSAMNHGDGWRTKSQVGRCDSFLRFQVART